MPVLFRVKAPPTPKFCKECGKELLQIDKRAHYDVYNGNEVFDTILHCPTLISTHPRYVWTTDDEFDDYWRELYYG